MADPRDSEARRRDVLVRLKHDADLWVATSSLEGVAHLVPLSFVFHRSEIALATLKTSVTARNVADTGRVRLGVGDTRDVVMIEGDAVVVELDAVEPFLVDAYVRHAKWDPRSNAENAFITVVPTRIQSWREENELVGREILGDRTWLVSDDEPAP